MPPVQKHGTALTARERESIRDPHDVGEPTWPLGLPSIGASVEFLNTIAEMPIAKLDREVLEHSLRAASSAGRRKHDEFHVKIFCHNTLAQLI